MKRTYIQTKMLLELDHFDYLLTIDGYAIYNKIINLSKKTKIVRVHGIETIEAWFKNGEELELDDWQNKKAERYLVTAALKEIQ